MAGLWDAMSVALNASEKDQEIVQVIDKTVVRAHQHVTGAKRRDRLKFGLLAIRAEARPRNPPES